MKKIVYPVIVFVLLQLSVLTALTLWIIWYVLRKKQYEGLMTMAQNAYSSIETRQMGYAAMVGGIILLFSILLGSTLLFIGWIRERLIHQQRANFFSGFTHELMTPITCIQMNLETLLSHDLEKAKKDKLLQAAFSESQRLKSTINNILEMTKIEHKRKTIQKEFTDLSPFLNAYIQEMKKRYPQTPIHFESEGPVFSMIDEKAFLLMLNNLLENSLKYCSQPKINISLKKSFSKAEIHFEDNGSIGNIEKKNLFKIFYRGNTHVPGTGLGLYIVKNIVALHQGTIEVFSKENGTIFVIKIPLKVQLWEKKY